MSDPTPQTNASSPVKSVTAAPEAVTLFDLSDRTQIEILGADRAKFLHGFCTNDIKSLQPGQGCEAFLTNIKGRVVGHVFVFASSSSLWLDTVPGQEEFLIGHLDRYLIREDVQLVGRSQARGELLVSGEFASQLLMLDEGLPLYGCESREAFGESLDVRRVDLLGEPGFLMSMPRAGAERARAGLLAVGCVEGTRDQFESRRIAAGFPAYGVDITDEQLAQEVARTKQCISFTKGCYLGQEPIARLDAMGHTNRELRRIQFAPGQLLVSGASLLSAETDDEAGVLTSVAPLPTPTGETMALGYLKTKFNKAGTPIRAMCGDQAVTGVVL